MRTVRPVSATSRQRLLDDGPADSAVAGIERVSRLEPTHTASPSERERQLQVLRIHHVAVRQEDRIAAVPASGLWRGRLDGESPRRATTVDTTFLRVTVAV
ncbi:MAG: hypothetical protein ABI699_14680 [Caldimonas sp.]